MTKLINYNHISPIQLKSYKSAAVRQKFFNLSPDEMAVRQFFLIFALCF